jgi:hypothetical protein
LRKAWKKNKEERHLMNLQITVNEAASTPPPNTPGTFHVRAHYTETDAGHLFGPFATKEAAENCATVLAAREGVVKATIEEATV